jgi:Predicted membrane protein
MPNPGSPQSQAKTQQAMPTMPKGTMIGMVMVMIITVIVMMFNEPIGSALNVVFQVIDFGGKWPVLTLVIAGLIMITLSTVVRSYMTDFVKQARSQHIQSSFNKEMRQAKLENNLYKLKKLQEQQPQMMAKSMEQSTQMMKVMPITMVFVIPIYAWVRYFLNHTADATNGWIDGVTDTAKQIVINLPWGDVDILGTVMAFIPIWIVIYTMISLPIGQLEGRIVRYFLLKKRLKELDRAEGKS